MIPFIFSRLNIPKTVPLELEKVINTLKKTKSQEECLYKAYTLLTKRYKGKKFMTYLKFPDLFVNNVETLWNKKGFMHCTHLNFLLRILLVKSNKFKEEDIILKIGRTWLFSPHQYLCVKLSKNKEVSVDIWGTAYGFGFGKVAKGFF